MSRNKTFAIGRSYHNGIVARRKGSRVRFWDPATATLSKWTLDPAIVSQNAATHRVATSLPRATVVDWLQPIVPDMVAYYGVQTVADLRAAAKALGIKVPSKARKADIIAALTN